MKIALVIEHLDVGRGGREASVAQMAAALADLGHEVTVLCQAGRSADDRVTVQALGASGPTRGARVRNFVSAVQQQQRDGGYDVVHATLPVPGAQVYQPRGGTVPAQVDASVRRRGALGKVFVPLFAPLNAVRRVMGELEREVMSDPRTHCLGVSKMVADEFDRYYGRTENVRVVYNAVSVPDVDAEQRAYWRQRLRYKLDATPEETIFITVAKNFALKGVDLAIEHFARWYHRRRSGPRGRLIVVGREMVEGYQRHASLRDVGRHVIFVGATDNVWEFYAAADACVLLSWYDPCSRVVLEATRWSIPSLTTAYNGAAEVVNRAGGCVVGTPRDRRAVVQGLTDLSDPTRRGKAAEACCGLSQEISMEQHAENLLDVYQEAVR